MDRFWNIKNPDGDTPVMYCLKNNKIEMACLINTPGMENNKTDVSDLHECPAENNLRDSLLTRQAGHWCIF